MPILPPEPTIFPENLFDGAHLSRNQSAQWWALYTMPRREKDLMRRLRVMEIEHFGPTIEKKTRSPSGRVRSSYIPLFAGYVFLRGETADRYQALTTNCVSRVLEVNDTDQLVHDLRQIHRLVEVDTPLTPESQIESGMKVRILSGSLKGLEGKVVKRRGADRIFVEVSFLQQGASIQLDDFDVERIDG